MRQYDKDFLLAELKRFFVDHGRIPRTRELNNTSGYPNWISYRTHFGTLCKALVAAGLPIDTFRIRPKEYSSAGLIQLLLNYKNEFGTFPGFSDLNKRGKVREYPHVRTYESRFGSLPKAVEIAVMIEEDGDHKSVTIESLANAAAEASKMERFKISDDLIGSTDDFRLSLNEVNHIIKSLEGVYCRTCEKIKIKLINKRSIYGQTQTNEVGA